MVIRLHHPAFRLLASPPKLSTCHSIQAALSPPPKLTRPIPIHRFFTSTTHHRSDNPLPTHYEVLNVQPSCSHQDLKKQFYLLSKSTHPDMNPNDPNASRRFSQISESYSILADPDKRRKYDRDVMRVRQTSSSQSSSSTSGSTFGSRPASGLSRRRGAFRGPPPSFYAQGGAKSPSSSSSSSSSDASPFSSPFESQPNYEFDPAPVYRTQTHEDTRRISRRAAAMAAVQAEAEAYNSDFWIRFIVVSGIIILGVTLASLVGSSGAPKGGMTKGDGSRRGDGRNEWTKG